MAAIFAIWIAKSFHRVVKRVTRTVVFLTQGYVD